MCGDCFVCIYLVCQCDGLELGRRNRRITVRESRLGLTVLSTKGYGLKFELRKDMIKLALKALSDSDLPVTKKQE